MTPNRHFNIGRRVLVDPEIEKHLGEYYNDVFITGEAMVAGRVSTISSREDGLFNYIYHLKDFPDWKIDGRLLIPLDNKNHIIPGMKLHVKLALPYDTYSNTQGHAYLVYESQRMLCGRTVTVSHVAHYQNGDIKVIYIQENDHPFVPKMFNEFDN